jgi:hypothetical protein
MGTAVYSMTLPDLDASAVAGLVTDAVNLLPATERPREHDMWIAHLELHPNAGTPVCYAGLLWDWPPPNVDSDATPVRGGGVTLPDFDATAFQTLVMDAIDALHDTRKPGTGTVWVATVDLTIDAFTNDVEAKALLLWDWPLADAIAL